METIRREERIVMEMRHITGGNSKAPLPGETYDQYMIRMAWLLSREVAATPKPARLIFPEAAH